MRDSLWPGAAEGDPQFREEILRAGRNGLPALGVAEVAAAVLAFPHPPVAAALGLATILAARVARLARFGRMLALFSAVTALALLVPFGVPPGPGGDSALAGPMLIELTLVVAVPVRPLEALVLGAAAELLYRLTAPGHDLFLAVLTILGTAAASALYRRRYAQHRSRQEALRIAEALSSAQLRAQLAENAAAIGKLAAAVTHEINTPLGSLTSSVDTLLVLAAKQASASPVQQERFVLLQADLRRAVQTSTDRIRSVIARLQRFISLDEAELQPANINELLSDVAILFHDRLQNGIKLEFAFQPVPTLMCRPQLLSAVFSNLLSNAINAANGEARIVVSTRRAGEMVEVAIEDNGRGMSAEEIENIFDPGFKKSGGRMASGNWSLFNSRQIVFEHGGEIRIQSAEGKGTTVWVSLPAN